MQQSHDRLAIRLKRRFPKYFLGVKRRLRRKAGAPTNVVISHSEKVLSSETLLKWTDGEVRSFLERMDSVAGKMTRREENLYQNLNEQIDKII